MSGSGFVTVPTSSCWDWDNSCKVRPQKHLESSRSRTGNGFSREIVDTSLMGSSPSNKHGDTSKHGSKDWGQPSWINSGTCQRECGLDSGIGQIDLGSSTD